jgi:aminoglycoside phosphotransferase (APT) family kinase protein
MAELDPSELRRRLDGASVVEVAPLSGGSSSLTFAGTRAGQRVVIKVAPPGVDPVAHRDVLRQARIIKALGASDVPVPTVLWEDAGDPPDTPPLYVMTHVEGECVEPLFDDCAPVPGLGDRYRNACRAMAALHRLEPTELGLSDEPAVDPVAEVHRWSDTLRTVDPALAPDWPEVRDALLDCAPSAMSPRVVHGDFRLGNLLAAGSHVNAVIDWEIWSIGDPRIDAGWFLINCDPDTYRRVDPAAGMVPPIAELIELYRSEMGCEVGDLTWFTALACFKSAATWSLIVKHNRRRAAPRAELEAMAAVLPRLLDRSRSTLA